LTREQRVDNLIVWIRRLSGLALNAPHRAPGSLSCKWACCRDEARADASRISLTILYYIVPTAQPLHHEQRGSRPLRLTALSTTCCRPRRYRNKYRDATIRLLQHTAFRPACPLCGLACPSQPGRPGRPPQEVTARQLNRPILGCKGKIQLLAHDSRFCGARPVHRTHTRRG
jgi:hypothetical protein